MSSRRVVIVCFPGVELLDVSGPASVFGGATLLAAARHGYRVELAAISTGPVRSSCGVALHAASALSDVRGQLDTLLVAGGFGPALEGAQVLAPDIARIAARARRIASVCSGAFLLAAAGLLRGKRVVTHWAGCSQLAQRYPDSQVESDPIYVRDGNLWTSAGVTAGIDLALALVEEDLGAALALEVARWGVMYLRRPGGQSQHSAPLAVQAAQDGRIGELASWIELNLKRELSVEVLARRVHMSVRNFARVFRRDTGLTPAAFVERLRLDAARRALELKRSSVKQIADSSGFGSTETMHRAFQRNFGVTPQQYRERFGCVRERGAGDAQRRLG